MLWDIIPAMNYYETLKMDGSGGVLPGKDLIIASDVPNLDLSLEGVKAVVPVRIGGKSKEDLLEECMMKGIYVHFAAKDLIEDPNFTTLQDPLDLRIGLINVKDLVPNPKGRLAVFDELLQALRERRHALVPGETALQYAIQHGNEMRGGSSVNFLMEPVDVLNREFQKVHPYVLGVRRGNLEPKVISSWTMPSRGWERYDTVAFRVAHVNKPS